MGNLALFGFSTLRVTIFGRIAGAMEIEWSRYRRREAVTERT